MHRMGHVCCFSDCQQFITSATQLPCCLQQVCVWRCWPLRNKETQRQVNMFSKSFSCHISIMGRATLLHLYPSCTAHDSGKACPFPLAFHFVFVLPDMISYLRGIESVLRIYQLLTNMNPIDAVLSQLRSILILSTHPLPSLPSGVFPSVFLTEPLRAFLTFILSTCPAHHSP